MNGAKKEKISSFSQWTIRLLIAAGVILIGWGMKWGVIRSEVDGCVMDIEKNHDDLEKHCEDMKPLEMEVIAMKTDVEHIMTEQNTIRVKAEKMDDKIDDIKSDVTQILIEVKK